MPIDYAGVAVNVARLRPHSGSVAVISVPGLALRSSMARIAAVIEGGGRPRTGPAPATPAVTGADRERKPAVGVARDR
ncbi:hypothetical protein ACFQ2Y_36145 [Streptomyces malaysiensis subsp. malaysiensis]